MRAAVFGAPAGGSGSLPLSRLFLVGRKLGDGAFGVVHSCTRRSDGRELAVKLIDVAVSSPADVRKEAQMLESLAHPNVVSFYGLFPEGARLCIVTEKLSGGDLVEGLQAHLRQWGSIDGRKIVGTARQLNFRPNLSQSNSLRVIVMWRVIASGLLALTTPIRTIRSLNIFDIDATGQTRGVHTDATNSSGMILTMDKCKSNIGSMKVGLISVECESLHDVTGLPAAYHCGFMAEAKADRRVQRRYDLGPRPFQLSIDPRDIAAVAIECTEAPRLHGSDTGKRQIPWPTALPRAVARDTTFAQLENFIESTQIVGMYYDLAGGNCQHFSFRMYEIMARLPCKSIKVPNFDTIRDIVSSVGGQAIARPIIAALKQFSDQFQDDQASGVRDCER